MRQIGTTYCVCDIRTSLVQRYPARDIKWYLCVIRASVAPLLVFNLMSNASLYIFFPPGVAVTVTQAFIVYVNVS